MNLFNLDNYKGNYVMHCKTRQEAKDFCKFLHEQGKTWCNGSSYLDKIYFDSHKEDTCYDFNKDSYSCKDYYEKLGYTILEWSDFTADKFIKDSLKTGDIVLRRNGDVEIFCNDVFIRMYGRPKFLADVKTNLESATDKENDIIAVRRPINNFDCQFDAFRYGLGELVYTIEGEL